MHPLLYRERRFFRRSADKDVHPAPTPLRIFCFTALAMLSISFNLCLCCFVATLILGFPAAGSSLRLGLPYDPQYYASRFTRFKGLSTLLEHPSFFPERIAGLLQTLITLVLGVWLFS